MRQRNLPSWVTFSLISSCFDCSSDNSIYFDFLDEFRNFVHRFAAKHDVQVLFNSAEPDAPNNKYFNSAVLVGPDGKEVAQYDKIYLLPFGESVPAPLQAIVPAFVGSFSYGKEYDLLPLGEAKAGVMICFESHFGEGLKEAVFSDSQLIRSKRRPVNPERAVFACSNLPPASLARVFNDDYGSGDGFGVWIEHNTAQ